MVGCQYDYASLRGLGGHAGPPGAAASGGGAGTEPLGGTGGGTPTGSGGQDLALGTNGGGGGGDGGAAGGDVSPATGGSGSGGSGSSSVGTGGQSTGGSGSGLGTGGSATGGSTTGGSDGGQTGGRGGVVGPGSGGQGTGGAGGVGGGGGSETVLLSIDFVGGRWVTPTGGSQTYVPGVAMASGEVAGVKPAAQWNAATGASGTLASLVLSNNVVSTASVVWQSPSSTLGPGVWNHAYATTSGDAQMMNGYLDPLSASAPATVTVSNLPATLTAASYDVYVYVTGEITSTSTRTCRYTLGAASFSVSEVGPTPTSFAGYSLASDGGTGNYIVFKKVTGSSFKLTATPGTTAPTRAPVDGIQLVFPSGT